MTREWQPGDVAAVTNTHGVENVAICAVTSDGFVWKYGVADTSDPVDPPRKARPLAVIDPEDREAVDAFYLGFLDRVQGQGRSTGHMDLSAIREVFQQALREYADPKPEPCRASVNVSINTNFIAASCAEPKDHEGSHRDENGTCWDASEGVPS